ncbi:MAG: hypothetical protein JNL57_01300 [Bacteroidetes bacterium]|nr:hypothetical protein [Bacteroidota bacterium]
MAIISCNQAGPGTKPPKTPDTARQTAGQKSPDNREEPVPTNTGVNEHDPALVGLWKNTEILGSGDITMTNESMMELFADGTIATWPGRSVGPDYSRDEDKSKMSRGNWYTRGKSLHFVDPATSEDGELYYTVSETGLLLGNGGQKKVLFVRVR